MSLVVAVGIWARLTKIEWCMCIILCGMVISAELINSAIEAIVDMVMPDIHPMAKVAKDAAAGAVLICAISAFIIGGLIFVPKIFNIL